MVYGIGLSAVIALIALFIDNYISIGSAVIAIVIGLLISNTITIPHQYNKGIGYSEKSILAFAIATMGISLDFSVLLDLGIKTLFLILSGIGITIISAIFLGKILGIDKKLSLLLGIGNGICGASAIGASKDIVKASESEVGISVAVVNFLGTIGIFLVPFIALLVGLDEKSAGILVGNTLQAVGQAVAGGFAISEVAGQNATVIKMGRVLTLAFVLLILIFIFIKSETDDNIEKPKSIWKNIPHFIFYFLFFSFIATLNLLPEFIVRTIKEVSHLALVVAMAAIGLKISFSSIKANGKNALILGSLVFIIQIIYTSIFLLSI